ncbi:MAG: hypothetical protein OEV40_21160, partial [Acidimicrobiia bacterium]|nr:hypothetical protein [Acidimicrobiia bacterium]
VVGIDRLLTQLQPTDWSVRALGLGIKELNSDVLTSLSGTNRGILGELLTAREFDGVLEFRKTVFVNGRPREIDVVADGGATWIDVKTGARFTLNSSNWNELRAQASRLVEAAAHPENHVAGASPTVVYVFRGGVSDEVRQALVEIGARFSVRVEVRAIEEVPG